MGVARIFQSGGHTESYIGYSPDYHLNIVDCLLTKRLTKGGHGHPRTPLATPLHYETKHTTKNKTKDDTYNITDTNKKSD